MTKSPAFALSIALSAIALCTGGCGKSEPSVSQTEEPPVIKKTTTAADKMRTASVPFEYPPNVVTKKTKPSPTLETPQPATSLSDKETAALLDTAEQLTVLSQTNPDDANAKLQVLFSASAKDAKRYSSAAQFIAQRIADEAAPDSAQFARSYLILASFREAGIDDSLLDVMAKFACEYPESNRPIKLYKQLSSHLIADGQGKSAVSLLQHGIKHCESCREVESLKRINRMTMQTMSLLGRTKTTSVTRQPAATKQSGDKPSKTSPKSDYYELIGKTASLSGKTLQGTTIGSQQLRGEWVYAHFWATW